MGKRGPKNKAERAAEVSPVVVELETDWYVPPKPRKLTRDAQAVWSAVWSSEVARRSWDPEVHRFLVERYITYVNQWVLVGRRIAAEEKVSETLLMMQKRLEMQLGKLERALGLTPKALADLGLTIAQARLTAEHVNAMARRPEWEPDEDDGWSDA